ncbi:MAG: hypothetical protein H8D67_17395 [Deltaproteobacteria bacterium]|nr:hypothetical protein [Deltaproteobacteria bacterium]
MALPVWLPLLMQGAGMLGKKFLSGNVDPDSLFDEDKLTLSDSDIGMMRGQNLRNVQDINTKNISEIKKTGAARRLPSGAIMSAVKGAGYETARGASEIEPKLRTAQIESLRPLEMMRANLKVQNQAADNAFFGQGFGDIFKTILLWKAGLLGGGDKGYPGSHEGFGMGLN